MTLPPAYVHIGAPKAASKSLQQHLFMAHPQLGHTGLGAGGPVGWTTKDLQRRIEADLRCCKPLLYDAEAVARAWTTAAATVRTPEVRRVGLSYENLTITMPLDVDVTEKARRVRDLLGPDTKVLFVVREQRATVRSAYAELLLNGLDTSFSDTVDNLLRTHLRSWLSDLSYGKVFGLWRSLFGPDRVQVVFFEELVARPQAELARIQAFLGVDPLITELPRQNRSLTDTRLSLLLALNQRMRHDASDRPLSLFQADRLAPHLRATWPELSTAPDFINATLGRAAARAARSEEVPSGVLPLDRSFQPDQLRMLHRLFARDNAALAEHLGRPLPAGYLLPHT
jgi:hypothetical protein